VRGAHRRGGYGRHLAVGSLDVIAAGVGGHQGVKAQINHGLKGK
jgi:hypothetical protein